jgi:hypothetical protein
MGFYTFHQNSSGGTFHIDRDVREYVIVEGTDLEDITERAKQIGLYFNGVDTGDDCECCGDRWCKPWGPWSNLTEVPMIYDSPVYPYGAEYANTANIIIHYMDGTRKYSRWL